MTTINVLAKPPIILTAEDFERLSTLASAATSRMPDLAAELADELERAHVVAKDHPLEDVVCMESEVEFRDETTGKVQHVRLVYPEHADISIGNISVLTPVGTALIGLRAGQLIAWQTPRGELRKLTVLAVRRGRA
jgi:regulator of nucleoside diphosphate kinase